MSHSLQPDRPKVSRASVLRSSILLVLAVITLELTSPFASSQKTDEDLPSGSMQARATTSCLECHEARIILQQRLSKAGWTKEVDKMVKWGAVVDASDRDALIDYLSTNFSPDRPPYEAPRASSGKESSKNNQTKKAK